MRTVSLAVALFFFWLLLSGHYTPFLIAAGAVFAIFIAVAARRIGYADEEGHPVELVPAGFVFWPWLVKEIVKSALAVTRIILQPGLPISPVLIRVKPSERTAVGTVTYANSITLTPGTLTVEVDRAKDELVVHALTKEGAEELLAGEMDRRVRAFEGRA